ncbi:MAG: hypothetical protein P8Y63_13230 [Deltaproteobacteria bacterium]|jgi:hypothetical protein
MSKKLLTLALALSFGAATAGVSFAQTANCEVKSVDGNTVVLDCGKDASKLSAGSNVKVKAEKKKMSIEGC